MEGVENLAISTGSSSTMSHTAGSPYPSSSASVSDNEIIGIDLLCYGVMGGGGKSARNYKHALMFSCKKIYHSTFSCICSI